MHQSVAKPSHLLVEFLTSLVRFKQLGFVLVLRNLRELDRVRQLSSKRFNLELEVSCVAADRRQLRLQVGVFSLQLCVPGEASRDAVRVVGGGMPPWA